MDMKLLEDSFENFEYWMGFHIDLLNKVADVKRLFNNIEKAEIAEAFVLKILLSWELLCEFIIVESFRTNTSNFQKVTGIPFPRRISRGLSLAIIEGERYLDFRGFEDLLKKSKTYFGKRRNPFGRVPSQCRKRIDAFYAIRNHIAHQSRRSKKAFRRICWRDHKIRGFVTPGGLLLRKHPTQVTVFNEYVQAFFQAAEAIEEFLLKKRERR